MFGASPASLFGIRELKAVRALLIDCGLGRSTINHRVGILKAAFRWAVEERHVPAAVWHELAALRGLRAGDGGREPRRVGPVADEHVRAILPFCTPTLRAMVELHLLTGMRSGELCSMRPCDILSRGGVAVYSPADHKGRRFGRERMVPLGPRAWAIVSPLVAARDGVARGPDEPGSGEPVFSPAQSMRECRAARRRRRKSKVQPSQRDRASRGSRRRPGPRWTSDSYRRAVSRAIRAARAAGADVPAWHPHQIRHRVGTRVRERFGLEAAQAVLGHASLQATQIYAEPPWQKAVDVMRRIG
jgi:integrase